MSNRRPEPGSKVIQLADRTGRKRRRFKPGVRKLLILLIVVALAGGGILYFTPCRGYEIVSEQTHTDGNSGSIHIFGSGFLRYTVNGVQYIDSKQMVVWETAYEMKNPTADVCENRTAAVADMDGNQIFVFDKKGLLGSIKTTMPIQAFAVSEQGIVATIVRNQEQTKLILYSPDGQQLVEGRASFADTGYPLALDISSDGQKVLVSHVSVGETVATRIIGYNFTNINASDTERIMLDTTYPDMIVPEVGFIGDKNAYAIANGALFFYSGSDSWKERNRVDIEDTIRSVTIDGDRIGVVTERLDQEEKYSLGIYTSSGRRKNFLNFKEDHTSIYMRKGQVFLLEGTHCIIRTVGGRRIFEGDLDTPVSCLVPVFGFHKYLVAEEGRVEILQLVR